MGYLSLLLMKTDGPCRTLFFRNIVGMLVGCVICSVAVRDKRRMTPTLPT